jgi:hypothetical protein
MVKIPVNIRYETEDAVSLLESGEDRGATALDPDAIERAQARFRQSNGIPLDAGLGPGSQPTRRNHSIPVDPVAARRSSSMATDPMIVRRGGGAATDPMVGHRSSPIPIEPMGGITQPYQRARGKKRHSELDPGPTQTFGPADPLPPSPAAREQTEGWFRPSLFTESIPDLSALAGDTNRTYDPHMHGHGHSMHGHSMHGYGPGFQYPDDVASAMPPQQRSMIDLQGRPWLFSALLAATCLAVGMVLGALLFAERAASGPPAERDQVVIRCSDPPAR